MVHRGYFHLVQLWSRTRAGMGGYALPPQAGGLNDQPAWLVEALSMLDSADAEMAREDAAAKE